MKAMLSRRGVLTLGAAIAALGSPSIGRAQGRFPTRDLTWLIYQSPGGSIDVGTRTIAPFLEAQGFRSQFEYAVGAGGRIARTRLFTARPDGHTIMTEVAPGVSVDTALFEVPYRAPDFAPLYGWQATGGQLNVRKDSPITNMAEFIAACRQRRMVVASIGRGGAHHIQLLAMRRDLDIPFDIVHFNGAAAAYAQVIGGHVDASIGGPASGARSSDNLTILGFFGEQRSPALPETPTIAEQGLQVQIVSQLFFASIRSAVPEDRRTALSNAFREAFRQQELVERMARTGDFPVLLEPERIREILAAEGALVTQFAEALRA